MTRVALIATFDPDSTEQIADLRAALVKDAVIEAPPSELISMNLASWLLPNTDAALEILPHLKACLQINLQLHPIIQIENNVLRCCLAPVVNHVLVSWHFYMHKELELPYLAINDADVPKRWRPVIDIGTVKKPEALKNIAWPTSLRCQQLAIINMDNNAVIARQDLIDGPVPW